MARISKNAAVLRDQLTDAIAGITAAGLNWPTTAPTSAQVTTQRDALAAKIISTDAAKDTWQVEGELKRLEIGGSYDMLTKVVQAATLLHGPSSAEMNNYGVSPEGVPLPPLAKLTDLKTADGNLPGSVLFDWENIEGASYEVQWASDSAFNNMVGSATATQSEYMVAGLTSGTQYWMRVRPVRGSQTAPWSDPATRVAPL
ncbi:MAG: fibronectin type III domain-containing protein [Fimbriimonadaceae bacterium]